MSLQHHLLKRLSFLHWIAVAHLSKISSACLCRSISGFSILLQCSRCLSLYQYHPVLITVTTYYDTTFWNCIDWLFQIYVSISNTVLAILDLLPFQINFKVILSIVLKDLAGILIRIVLNLCKNLKDNWHIYYVESSKLWTQYLDLWFFFNSVL